MRSLRTLLARGPWVTTLVVLGALAAAHECAAAIDLTGNWSVVSTVTGVGTTTMHWSIVQTGTALAISSDGVSPPFYTGFIDPDTGVMSFGGNTGDCFGGGSDGLAGVAAPDSNSFTASGTAFIKVTPTTCGEFAVSLVATRDPCGNGVVDAGEACDDGNLLAHDCCSFTCTVYPDGTACDGGNCAAGVCMPTGEPRECTVTPLGGCKNPGKSILSIHDKSPSGASEKDRLVWKWNRGPAAVQTDFGDPLTTAEYHLCLYATTTGTLVFEADVPAGSNWSAVGSKGYKYKELSAAHGGISQMLIKGSSGSSKLLVKGRDGNLDLSPTTLPLTGNVVTVQLSNSDNANCWQATFAPSAIIKDNDEQYHARTP